MEKVRDPWYCDRMCQSVSGPSGSVLWRGLCHPAWALLCQPAHACPWLHCQSLHWPAQQLWYIYIFFVFFKLCAIIVICCCLIIFFTEGCSILVNLYCLLSSVLIGSSSSNHFSTPRQTVLPPLPLPSLSGTQPAHRSPPSTHRPVWIFQSSLNKATLQTYPGLYSFIPL